MKRCSQAEQLYEQLYGVKRTLRGAAITNMRQELSRTIWCEDDVVLTSRGSFGTRMRCSNSYLQRLGVPAAAARRVSEGHLAKIKCWYWRADTARGKLISSRKQIIRDTERLQINLPRKINWWGEIWTWRIWWRKSRC